MLRARLAVPLLVAFAAFPVDQSTAQQTPPTGAEKALAAQIKCEDFKRNPDGSWVSGPHAMIGTNHFSSSAFGAHAFNLGGADLAVVLDRKCAGH